MIIRHLAFIAALSLLGAPIAQGGGPTVPILDQTGVAGGLVVHVGCSGSDVLERIAALHRGNAYVVHVLDTSTERVAQARQFIHEKGLEGAITAECFDGQHLPYVDNLVNLLVADSLGRIPKQEVMRVLVPRGVAWIGGKSITKPWPESIDEWTHFLHDADGNAVANDREVDSPRGIQWTAGPAHTRYHDALASLSAMTSSHGRLFYIFDEGPTSLVHRAPAWKLIARDAFNGTVLWKRAIPTWVTHLYYFRTGPLQVTRRLVSIAETVYATLGLDAPVSKLDAATGRTLMKFKGSEHTEELICHNGVLLTAIGDPTIFDDEAPKVYGYWQLTVNRRPTVDKTIVAYDATSGDVLWRIGGENLRYLVPLSLCACGDRVLYLDNENLHCVDLKTGRPLWKTAFPTKGLFLRGYAPTVVAVDDAVLCLTWDRLGSFSLQDGHKLWQNKGAAGFASPGDLFVIDGLAWTVPLTSAIWNGNRVDRNGRIKTGIPIPRSDFLGDGGRELWGIDIHSGEVRRKLPRSLLPGGHHHRCYRNKATCQYLICGRRGLEFVDLAGDHNVNNWWVRGICQYGIMPANGLVYVPPDPCHCFDLIKVNGFLALAHTSSSDSARGRGPLGLQEGPAYGTPLTAEQATALTPTTRAAADDTTVWNPPAYPGVATDWPTYRGNISRSGSTRSHVPTDLKQLWRAELGGPLTAPVKAGNRLFLCDTKREVVLCLDSQTGTTRWRFAASGRVNSPPTIQAGYCIFGCGDGSVYCLTASEGTLVWRFRASPIDRRTIVDNRLESVWPVDGSVLVQNRTVYFAAGRSSYLDGGIHLFALDLASGRQLNDAVVQSTPVYPGKQEAGGEGALPDVLISDGTYMNMRQVLFDNKLHQVEHRRIRTIIATTGLLEASWFHRQNWCLGSKRVIDPRRHAAGIPSQMRSGPTPMGKLISFDDRRAYCVMDPYTWLKKTPSMYPPNHDGHLHQKFSRYSTSRFPIGVTVVARTNQFARKPAESWAVNIPFQPRAMVLADDTLFLAGWRDAVTIKPRIGRPLDPTHPNPKPSFLHALATTNGSRIAAYPLASPPVFDGMIAAGGRIYIALQDGTLVCLGHGG